MVSKEVSRRNSGRVSGEGVKERFKGRAYREVIRGSSNERIQGN